VTGVYDPFKPSPRHRRTASNPHGQQLPGWVQYPETLRGFTRSSELVLGFRAQLNQSRRNPLVTPPIGINAPFRHVPDVLAASWMRLAAAMSREPVPACFPPEPLRS
jgi:hypothetical protein